MVMVDRRRRNADGSRQQDDAGTNDDEEDAIHSELNERIGYPFLVGGELSIFPACRRHASGRSAAPCPGGIGEMMAGATQVGWWASRPGEPSYIEQPCSYRR
jgi:hypothetical protein